MDSLSQVQQEIKSTLEEYESLKNVESHINEIESKLKLAYNNLKELSKRLDKELKDIENLEGISLKGLFYKTLGNKEDQMDKERQDYLEVSLKYKEYKKEIELMEFEHKLLRKKLNNLPELKIKLEDLKKKRTNEILSSPQIHLRNEFQEILRKMDTSILLNRELEEAIEEGEKAVKLLAVVSSYLRKAGKWGQWDMAGKNRRGAYMKHQSIDKALKELPRAQHQLNIFTRELKDLGENNINFKLNMVQFNRFTDFFFDNLISDWIIQQRIKSTINNIESTRDHTQRILLNLKQEKEHNDARFASLNDEKNHILLS
ncbi:MAG: hypothetical protein KJO50_02065 [Bacteroidia bacterium]|nr:hypothetical protein [Bacteroidia bacterium]